MSRTGWCRTCSSYIKYCESCGEQIKQGNLCIHCRRRHWLKVNADAIENWLLQGLTYQQAVMVVIERNRPVCLNCGDTIKHGTNGRHFLCNSKSECRTVRRRYKYLIYEKGVSKDIALRMALGLEREAA